MFIFEIEGWDKRRKIRRSCWLPQFWIEGNQACILDQDSANRRLSAEELYADDWEPLPEDKGKRQATGILYDQKNGMEQKIFPSF